MNNYTLTALSGVRVGHSTHIDKLTGCTFICFDKSYPVAYKAYGGACGTYNTDLLHNGSSYFRRNGLFIAGGSLNGLSSATTISNELINHTIGPKEYKIVNPNISGAIVFDMGTRIAQYDPIYGKEAFDNLSKNPVENGNVGAGTGVTVGKFQYLENGSKMAGMKAGVGSGRVDLDGGVKICALSVVNALGNIINSDGTILAGNRDIDKPFKTFDCLTKFVTEHVGNTTISIIGINVDLQTRENYERVAHIASHGQIRSINPVNTSIDGDTVFVFSTEEKKDFLNKRGAWFGDDSWPLFHVDIIGQAAAKAVQESIYSACHEAESIQFKDAYKGIIPSIKDYPKDNV